MTPIERMSCIISGRKPDRPPFMPTILEHAARFAGKTPSDAAKDPDIAAESHIAAYRMYGHDAVTAGIDIYNIEAEALGCDIKYHDDNSVPGVLTHPFPDGFEKEDIIYYRGMGRTEKILEAASKVKAAIGSEVSVGAAVCGPFSICAELMGFESLLMCCLFEPDKAKKLLEMLLEFQFNYCGDILKEGLSLTIFESWAAPPLVSPQLYSDFAAPFEKELISFIQAKGRKYVPLVIGGDTSEIVNDIISTGTSLLVSDFKTDIKHFLKKASDHELVLRRNIDPKIVESGSKEELKSEFDKIIKETGNYERFVLGTGVLPYGTPAENVLYLKSLLMQGDIPS